MSRFVRGVDTLTTETLKIKYGRVVLCRTKGDLMSRFVRGGRHADNKNIENIIWACGGMVDTLVLGTSAKAWEFESLHAHHLKQESERILFLCVWGDEKSYFESSSKPSRGMSNEVAKGEARLSGNVCGNELQSNSCFRSRVFDGSANGSV